MKGFNRLLLIAIIFATFYYIGWQKDQKNVLQNTNQGGAPSTVQVQPPKAPSQNPPATSTPTSLAGRMLPPWPPAAPGDTVLALADSLTRKNFLLIFDGSGSMARQGCSGDRSKYEVAREAVVEWATSVPEDANLGLVVFDRNGFSTRLSLGTGNRRQFTQEIEKVVPDNKTPLTMALDTAYQMLTEQGRKQLGYGEYTMVIITDGAADDINSLAQSVNMVLTTSPIMIRTIGFCIADDHSLNSHGRTSYLAANNPAELRRGLQEVLAEAETFDIQGFQ